MMTRLLTAEAASRKAWTGKGRHSLILINPTLRPAARISFTAVKAVSPTEPMVTRATSASSRKLVSMGL